MTTYIIVDIETTGLNRFKNEIVMVGVFIPNYDFYSITYTKEEFIELAMRFPPDSKFVFQNGKFDALFIEQQYGVRLPIDEDVMLLSYVIDMGAPKSLDYLAEKHFGIKSWDIPLEEKMVVTEKSKNYLKGDLYYTWMLFYKLRNELTEEQKLLYEKLVMPSFNAYREVERNGIQIDVEGLNKLLKEYETLRDQYKTELAFIKDINWNSSTQLAAVLYGEMYLPILERTEGGKPSTSAPVLRKLSKMGYEIVDKILSFRFYNNAINTFLSRWKDQEINGRLYPTFNIDTTRTGRTSCSDPNLQQVPRKVELRSLFTARPGYVLIEADQSQVELRVAAHYSKDPTMIKVYQDGGDLHTQTAKVIARTDTPTKQDRTKAKPVNFGFLYGMVAKSFPPYAEDNYDQVFTLEEATEFRNRFFSSYPKLLTWYELQKQECLNNGGVSTLFGRFRKIPDIYSSSWKLKSSAERISINTPVQSSASDILISGLIEIVLTMPEVFVVGTVHDSILVEVPIERSEECKKRIVEIMKNPKLLSTFGVKLLVPLDVDAEEGNWGTK